MQVESGKVYLQGFVLKEQDLRRLHELIHDQLKKIGTELIVFTYNVKYENGALAQLSDFEELFKMENSGSAGIVRLEILATYNNDDSYSISIEFRNVDSSNEDSNIPIKHQILGKSRDWVFVTSSLIEERIHKIRRLSLNHLGQRGFGRIIFRLILPMIFPILFFIPVMLSYSNIDTQHQENLQRIINIENKWSAGKYKEPMQMIIDIEKTKVQSEISNNKPKIYRGMSMPKWAGLTIVIFLLAMFFLYKYYTVYNFCWGEYLEIFQRKESTRKIILGIIVGTVLLGILVNLLSSYIWEKL